MLFQPAHPGLTQPPQATARRSRPLLALAFWAVALLSSVGLAHAQGELPTGKELTKECQSCHNDPHLKTDAGKSMAVITEEFRRSGHRKVECADCHVSEATAAHLKDGKQTLGPVSPQVCVECHEDAMKAVIGSAHSKYAGGDKAIRDCVSCHNSMHTVTKSEDPASPMSPVNQIKTCGECHEDMMADYEHSRHARGLIKGGLTKAAPSCTSCHGSHDMLAKDNPASKIAKANIAETCGSCHVGVQTQWAESVHGQKLAENAADVDAPSCATCHQPHKLSSPSAASTRRVMSEGCGDCHKERADSYMNSYHGKAVALDNRKAASCADCHTAHGNFPASDPRSSVHVDNLATTCGSCHSKINASFLTFDSHAVPSDPNRNAYLYWIWLGMTSLLIGVFAFFGLHGLLWLQRALVGKLRGEFTFGHHSDGPYVRRFSTMQMGVHLSIVTSFLLLAATGLPLKFPETPWAPTLIGLLGGAEVAGWLHRLGGAVTFGYFIWHLGMLVHGMVVKKERGYFWGPRSMVPQWKDAKDFFGMMKYFLYLGPRPKFDRFTYWEKFDYLAVFWGVAIIGVSGLVLWFPAVFTAVLPGWVVNAAYVVHSDEALLATGFIFLFHFFHTHLRPEAFPLDPVVFVGSMPLERFKEERPLEYERLVANGTLESYLVPPPTAAALRRAHIFGFTAVVIGVTLAVFIFWGLLTSGLH